MIRTLVLYVSYPSRVSYYDDWLYGFQTHPNLSVVTLNLFKKNDTDTLETIIKDFELVVILHSCTADSLLYVNPIKPILLNRKCPLICFVGNELNMPHIKISDKLQFIKDISADFIASQLLQETAEWLYADCNGKIISVPHALNPNVFRTTSSYTERPIKFGARSFRYPSFLGDNDRNDILEYFQKNFNDADISFEHRLTPQKWSEFLNQSKSTVSTEAGSWYLEKNDATVLALESYLRRTQGAFVIRPNDSFKKFINGLPFGLKKILSKLMKKTSLSYQSVSFSNVDFEEVFELFFKNKSCPVYGKCISSRHFDAIGTSTIQIMFPGRFNDILAADKHYIALKRDFSNIKEVLEKIDDPGFCMKMATDNLNMILENHTYQHRVETILKLI